MVGQTVGHYKIEGDTLNPLDQKVDISGAGTLEQP